MATIEDLKDRRAALADGDTVAILLDDLIERREKAVRVAVELDLLAQCRVDLVRAGHVEVVTLTHIPTGRAVAGSTKEGALAVLRKALTT